MGGAPEEKLNCYNVSYLAFLWSIIRPRSFKRDAAKLAATSEKTETILQQLKINKYET
jgi:hypothetical protein